MNDLKADAKAIFLEALDQKGPDELIRFLDQACGADAALRGRVEELLRAHLEAGNFLGKPDQPEITQDEPITERPGTVIGPYKLLQQIGEGGMGTVFMAEQTEPVKRKVALKIINPGMDSRQIIARFEAERQALAMMDHPNIAKVLDAGTTSGVRGQESGVSKQGDRRSLTPDSRLLTPESGRPYFVMELVKGVPITKFCDDHHLTPRERLELFLPVCHAVQHAHQKGIIHRDLKPSNVLVALYDDKPVPKIIDFGVAKATGPKLTDRTMFTQFGQMVGTLEYMSPEQASFNALDIDTRSDIYSLGVLLYELLTGTTPLSRKRLKEAAFDEMLRIIREEEPPRPSTRLSTTKELPSIAACRKTEPYKLGRIIKGDLDWIVMKSLEKDRARRYETANGLAMDVQRYLADEPVLACPPSAGYKLRKFARKNRKILCVAAAFALVLMAGTLVSIWQAIRARQAEHIAGLERDRAEAETKRSRRNLYDAHMRLAQSDWEEARVKRVLVLLDQHRPTSGEEDLRGFEWHYLRRLTDTALTTFTGHQRLVWSVAYSPDGKRLATAGEDGTVKMWDADSGREIPTVMRHSDQVLSVAFSPDGKRLASASHDRTVKLWDVASGQMIRPFQGHSDRLTSVTFSPDGKRLASSSHDGTVKVWDTATGMKILDFKGDDTLVRSVAFSPDGKWLASASRDKMVKVWDASTGVRIMTLPGHTDEVTSIAFSPDGKRLASGSLDRTVRIWDIASPRIWDIVSSRLILTLKGHTDRVFRVAFSPDGKHMASASVDQTVKVWDLATGEEAMTLKGHTSWVSSVAFSPDGRRLASASQDGTVKLWDVSSGGGTMMVISDSGLPKCVAFSPDGKRLASAGADPRVKIWDGASGRMTLILKGHKAEVRGIAYSPDGKWLASASLDKTVKLWDAISGREIRTLMGPTGWVLSVAFSPQGKFLVAGSQDKTVWVWDLDTAFEPNPLVSGSTQPLALHGHNGAIFSVAFSPDGQRLASASADQTIKLWDAASGRIMGTLKGHASWVSSVAFSPDGQRLASASSDATVKIWDIASGHELQTLEGHTFAVNGLAFSPNGKRLASGGADKVVKVWDTISGQETLTLKGQALGIPSVAFSPDGLRIASACFDGTVRVYDARPWTPQLRTQEEARTLINLVYAKVGSKAEVIRQIEQDATLSDEVRQEALEMTKPWREDTR